MDMSNNIHIPYLSDFFNCDLGPEQLVEQFDPSINLKTIKKIKQGKININRTIDLHGLYLDEAKEAFISELQFCFENQLKYIMFIHGKGRIRNSNTTIKTAIYNWLLQIPNILGFTSAPRNMGGAGATIIYLRTKRKKDKG